MKIASWVPLNSIPAMFDRVKSIKLPIINPKSTEPIPEEVELTNLGENKTGSTTSVSSPLLSSTSPTNVITTTPTPTCYMLPDVPYMPDDERHEKHHLDLYFPPSQAVKPYPVVIHVHGGGWKRGDRKIKYYGGPYMGRAFSKEGFLVVVLSYRLRGYPAHMFDLASAVRWTKDHIAEYGGDPSCVFISGHSAGAHMAALLLTDPQFLQHVGVERRYLKGAMLISGIFDLARPCVWGVKNTLFRYTYVLPTFGGDEKKVTEASPLYHLTRLLEDGKDEELDAPPFLVLNAQTDYGLWYTGKEFYKTLLKVGARSEYVIVSGTHHANVTRSERTVQHCLEFLYGVLACAC